MTRHALALAALLLSLGPASALAQQSEVQFITARFERYVDALRRHDFPAFSVMIALPGASKLRPGSVGTRARVGAGVVIVAFY